MQAPQPIESSARQLAGKLGIRPDIFETLPAADDWSFIIKAHALIEAAMTRYVGAKLQHQGLERVLSRMSLRGPVSKLAFFKVLGGSDRIVTFIDRLTDIRNSLVHDVGKIDYSLSAWVGELKAREQLADTAAKLIPFRMPERFRIGEKCLDLVEAFEAFPKHLLAFSVIFVVGVLYDFTQVD